jgi:hypothetical protein
LEIRPYQGYVAVNRNDYQREYMRKRRKGTTLREKAEAYAALQTEHQIVCVSLDAAESMLAGAEALLLKRSEALRTIIAELSDTKTTKGKHVLALAEEALK